MWPNPVPFDDDHEIYSFCFCWFFFHYEFFFFFCWNAKKWISMPMAIFFNGRQWMASIVGFNFDGFRVSMVGGGSTLFGSRWKRRFGNGFRNSSAAQTDRQTDRQIDRRPAKNGCNRRGSFIPGYTHTHTHTLTHIWTLMMLALICACNASPKKSMDQSAEWMANELIDSATKWLNQPMMTSSSIVSSRQQSHYQLD